jgi:adenylate kinase
MKAISAGLGSGAIKQVALGDVIDEEWSEMLSLNLKMKMSPEFNRVDSNWHCEGGITSSAMKLLNDEFNLYRSLFPLKVFIGGPPGTGKTHYTKLLAEGYGIPHLKIGDMIEEAKKQKDGLSQEISQII